MIFNTEFQNFIIPGNFQKFSGTLDFAWKWTIFCQFWCIGYQFNLTFVTEHEFGHKNWKMLFFWCFQMSFNSKSRNYKRYKKTCPFLILRLNSCRVTKWNQAELMPNTSKLAKIGHFQSISRVPENFWKLLGMMKFWNSVLKMEFLVSGIHTLHVESSQN